MNMSYLKVGAVAATLCFTQVACYNAYYLTTDELEQLQSGNIAPRVEINSSEGPVTVRATTPIVVETNSGEQYSVSPFNFILSDSQLVAPDYDLLLARDQVNGGRVYEYSRGKTIALITTSIIAAGASFAAISILAGSDRGFGDE